MTCTFGGDQYIIAPLNSQRLPPNAVAHFTAHRIPRKVYPAFRSSYISVYRILLSIVSDKIANSLL